MRGIGFAPKSTNFAAHFYCYFAKFIFQSFFLVRKGMGLGVVFDFRAQIHFVIVKLNTLLFILQTFSFSTQLGIDLCNTVSIWSDSILQIDIRSLATYGRNESWSLSKFDLKNGPVPWNFFSIPFINAHQFTYLFLDCLWIEKWIKQFFGPLIDPWIPISSYKSCILWLL